MYLRLCACKYGRETCMRANVHVLYVYVRMYTSLCACVRVCRTQTLECRRHCSQKCLLVVRDVLVRTKFCVILVIHRFWLDLTPNDIHWNLSDTGWAKSAWSSLFAPWFQGACVFMYHSPSFDPSAVIKV